MTRKEIEQMYDVNEYGIITSPGKFEGEMVYVPYFWELAMGGGGMDTEWDGNSPIEVFEIEKDDIGNFSGIFKKNDEGLILRIKEDSHGFVHAWIEVE